MGNWSEIKPSSINLAKVNGDYPWVFVIYYETPSDRDDNRWHTVLMFRNSDRTVFGIMEYDDLVRFDNLRNLARRIVEEKAFRDSLVSDDPDLPRLWKRR